MHHKTHYRLSYVAVPFMVVVFFLCGCNGKYSYTPLYPTPPNGYYQGVELGTVYNGNLIVAGQFNYLFNNSVGIAQWNGSTWQGLGSGVSGNYGPGYISCMATYNSNLIIGGSFTTAGGQAVNEIAQWNGSAWQSLSSGVYFASVSYYGLSVKCLTIYNGNLIAGGCFEYAGGALSNNIASWNGTSWQGLAGGTKYNFTSYYNNPIINAVTVYNGNLIAGGGFDTIGGQRALNIAQWNGTSWSAFGGKCNGQIKQLLVFNGNLIVQGSFDSIGGIATGGLAQWNGTTWTTINELNSSNFNLLSQYPNTVVYNNTLYFSTGNDSTVCQWSGSGSPVVTGIASTTKERWSQMAYSYTYP
ncbi:MAG TPA: hypothetical protein VK806_10905, partial [Bacteroidia bacterium]|nr:hypothetical protein [Bacteroidia bacterium]